MTGTAQFSRWWGRCCRRVGCNAGSILLVDSVNNRTNGSLNAGEATTALRSALAGNGKFTLVSAQQLAVAKQQLGLSPQDSLGSRSKAMGIARNVGAQYVLYSNATGNVNAPELKMQLMLVQTGEIIWSGKGAVSAAISPSRATSCLSRFFPQLSSRRVAEPEWAQRRECDSQRTAGPAARCCVSRTILMLPPVRVSSPPVSGSTADCPHALRRSPHVLLTRDWMVVEYLRRGGEKRSCRPPNAAGRLAV